MTGLSVPFADAIEDVSSGNAKLPQQQFADVGRYPVVDQGQKFIAGFTNDESLLCRVRGPLIIFGDHTRTFKYVDFPFVMGADGVKVLRVREGWDTKYVYHYLRSRQLPSAGYSRHYKFLKDIRVPMPPLEEQRRIAAILDRADTLRAKQQCRIVRIESLAGAMFTAMFAGSTSDTVSLGAVTNEFRYGTSHKSGESGFPILRIPNIARGALDTREIKRVSVTDPELSRLRLEDGDLLFVRTNGNREYVGRSAIFQRSMMAAAGFPGEDVIYASYLIRARLDVSRVRPQFVHAYLATSDGRRQLLERARTSAGQFNVNTKALATIRVPKVDMSAQLEFEAQVRCLHSWRDQVKLDDRSYDELSASLQTRAFAGEL